jgi:threonine dehydrogenase-like Zn-dependent dehydrogenase
VRHVHEGDRVALLSYNAYAQYDLANASHVVSLPAKFADRPFPGEALACAINIFRRSDIQAGHTVAIVGIGFLGAILTRLAQLASARVIAISRRPFALQVARQFGAHEQVLLDDRASIVEQVMRHTQGHGCERVIEAVGKQEALDVASDLTAERGRLLIAGYHQDGLRQVNMQLWNWRGLDVINAHERDPAVYVEGMRQAVAMVESGKLDPSPLYTHTFPLDRLGEALEAAANRPEGMLKALVVT